METESYLERSRRGGHLWLFFEKPLPGQEIRKFGQGLLKHFNIDSVELFPKAEQTEDRTGLIGQVAIRGTPKVRQSVWFLQLTGTANSTGIELANYGAGRP